MNSIAEYIVYGVGGVVELFIRRFTKPSTKLLMKIFRIFDKHGLIRDDLCFDPEHFMETVVREHWSEYE